MVTVNAKQYPSNANKLLIYAAQYWDQFLAYPALSIAMTSGSVRNCRLTAECI